ncbi:MAG: hypothetical protein EXS13_08895 [Planctomycetes bacterium]|nr:hypothetical protein [Planctomycetota bacterium]
MGWGVAHAKTYATRLEHHLSAAAAFACPVEVLNFSIPGYTMLEQLWSIDERVVPLAPHAILVSVTLPELRAELVARLAARVPAGRDLGFDFVRDVVARSGATAADDSTVAIRKLRPFTDRLVASIFAALAQRQRSLRIPIVVLLLKL